MSASPSDASSREQRLNAILHDYLQAVDAGQAPAKEEVLRGHPDLADELAAFFADQERMDRLAGDMRTTGPAESPDAAPLVRYVGDYELLEEIARGGMGVVYKARQVSLNRLVAVKMILSGRLAEPAEVERFRREAGAAAQLDHPNIVPIYEVGEHQGHHYYSMKLIEGDNLGVEMPHFTADHNAAALLLAKVARAVQHAHEHGILHRDIKPGNILLDAARQPHVADFGLARRLDESSSLSASGDVIGTVSYMAPEQAAAQCRRLTAAADVYALGAVLYEMLTGRPPFKNPNVVQTLRDVVEREPERPRKLNPRVPRDLEVICLKCLDKRPHRRYATAAALADDLERCVVGRPIQGRTVGRPERLWLWCRRQPVAVALAAAVFLVVVLSVGAVVVWRQGIADIQQAQKKAKADGDAALLKDADDRDNLRYLRLIGEASARLREGDLETAKRRLDECALSSRLIEWRYLYARITEPVFRGFPKETPNPNIPGSGPLQIRQVAFTADSSRVVILEDDELTVLSTSDQILEDRQAHVLTNPDDRHVVKSFKGSIGDIPLKSITTMSIDGDGSRIGLASVQPRDRNSPIATVGVWSLQTGAEVFRLSDVGGVGEVALSPDGRRFAAYAHEKTTVWDTSDGKSLFSFPRASSITFSPDSSRFAFIDNGTGFSPLRVRDATTGKELCSVTDDGGTFEGGTFRYSADVRYSADGRSFLCFSKGHTSIMDAGTGEVVFRVQMDVKAAAITRDGKRLLLLGQSSARPLPADWRPSGEESLRPDEDLTLWVGDALSGQEISSIPIPVEDRGSRSCLAAISPDGEHIGIFFRDASPWWFEPFQRRHILTMSGSDDLYLIRDGYALAASPDGRLIAGSNSEVRLAVFDAVTLKRIRKLAGDWPGQFTSRIAFSPDGRTLAAGNYWGVLKWWNVATGEEIHTIQGHRRPYDIGPPIVRDVYPSPPAMDVTLSFSPDGRRLASAWPDNVVTVMDVATGAEVFRLQHSGPVSGVLFRPDGKRIMSCEPGRVKEWDAASGTLIRESEIKLTAPRGYYCVALCYRGDAPCVVEDLDGTIVWDAEAGREIFVVQERPCMTAVTPDGKRLVTCDGFHDMVHVWDVGTGRELLSFSLGDGEDARVWITANGFIPINNKVLLSADGNRLFHCVSGLTVWDVSTTP